MEMCGIGDSGTTVYNEVSVLGPPVIANLCFASLSSTSSAAGPQSDKDEYAERLKTLEKWRFILSHFQKIRSKHQDTLRERLRAGIPDCLRGAVWQSLAESRSRKELLGIHHMLVKQPKGPLDSIILRDISRTFPKHILFRDRASMGQERLFNVLRAYSIYNPEVGYCQGMGFLAGLLLFYMDDEESNNVGPTMYASQWFMTIFSYNFPFEVVVRIWDIFLYEGKKTLFQVALAVLESQQDGLMQDSFERILQCLNSAGANTSAKELLNVALEIEVKSQTLDELEQRYNELSRKK